MGSRLIPGLKAALGRKEGRKLCLKIGKQREVGFRSVIALSCAGNQPDRLVLRVSGTMVTLLS